MVIPVHKQGWDTVILFSRTTLVRPPATPVSRAIASVAPSFTLACSSPSLPLPLAVPFSPPRTLAFSFATFSFPTPLSFTLSLSSPLPFAAAFFLQPVSSPQEIQGEDTTIFVRRGSRSSRSQLDAAPGRRGPRRRRDVRESFVTGALSRVTGPLAWVTGSSSDCVSFDEKIPCAEASPLHSIRVANIHHQRRPDSPLFLSQSPLFTAAAVLILNTWHWGRSQRTDDRVQDLANVQVALGILRSQQPRWPSSGFLVTVLERLLALDCLPTTQTDDPSDGVGNVEAVADTDIETLTTAEGLDGAAWIGLARAWLTSGKVSGGEDSLPLGEMPPVFVGDQELPDPRQAAARCVLGERT
ncbi:hypothetical protein C8R47DRAFT_1083286 [Mycena vitilis]|nr:hypothetical protein C8R47DRAFT_1083286 [Mycena vitilis]